MPAQASIQFIDFTGLPRTHSLFMLRPARPFRRTGLLHNAFNHAQSVPDLDIAVFAVRAAEHRLKFLEGDPPALLLDLPFEFWLAFIAQPAISIRSYPEFHIASIPINTPLLHPS